MKTLIMMKTAKPFLITKFRNLKFHRYILQFNEKNHSVTHLIQ